MVYQMARTTDELDPADQHELSSTSDSQTGILPEAEKFSLRTLLSPKNKEPSKISGLIVNVSSSLIGRSLPFPVRCPGSWACSLALCGFSSQGVAGRDEHPSSCTMGLIILASLEALPTETEPPSL